MSTTSRVLVIVDRTEKRLQSVEEKQRSL